MLNLNAVKPCLETPPQKIECCLYIYLWVLSIFEPGKFYFLKLENLILKE